MITTRQITKDQPSAALSARERLLHDPQIRRNKSTYANHARPAAPSVTVTFETSGPGVTLSRAEQEQQAIAIARTYRHYYLAEIAYQANLCEVTALIKPMHHTKTNALQITVDASGNANIEALELPAYRPSFRRLLLVIGLLATAATILAFAGLF